MKIAIIGAGASGLFLGMLLSKDNNEITIYHKGKIGRKILASGNGKCNISNLNITKEAYNNNLAFAVVKKYQNKLFDYFKSYKIYLKHDDEGRLYPYSDSSLSVLNIFLDNIKGSYVEEVITKITNKNGKYYLNNNLSNLYDKVIIATGSNANFLDYNNYVLPVDKTKIKFNEFKPSLVGFKTKNNLKKISGVRSKCNAKLYVNDNLIHQELGEVIFKDDGLSGICIMNLSSYYVHNTNNKNSFLELDLLPNLDFDDFRSVFSPKLYEYILENNINPQQFKLQISNTYSLEFAQVACGGISIDEIKPNFELKKMNNVYAIGEVLDVDGVCGGFNLMFAFTSAIKVFEDIENEISNK